MLEVGVPTCPLKSRWWITEKSAKRRIERSTRLTEVSMLRMRRFVV